MKFFCSLFLFFHSIFAISQKVNIDWQGSSQYELESKKINIPFFSNDGFTFTGNGIFLNYFIDLFENREYTIQNLYWESVAKETLYDIDFNAIPEREIMSTETRKVDEKWRTYYSVSAFKKSGNILYRLSSFDLISENSKKTVFLSENNSNVRESPLKKGVFYKIKVDKSGIFKITTQFLRKNGINPSSINPQNFKIYGNGGIMLPENNRDFRYPSLQENAIQVIGEEDGVWNEEDYVLFYAQGPHGYNLYNENNGNGNKRKESRFETSNLVYNLYEDYSYYFINFDSGTPGKRITEANIQPPSGNVITEYDEYQYIKEDKNNILKLGRLWVGDPFNNQKEFSFKITEPLKTGQSITYRLSILGNNAQNTHVKVSVNNADKNTLSFTHRSLSKAIGSINNIHGNEVKFRFSPVIQSNPNASFYLNYIEIQYKQKIKYNDQQFSFRDFSIHEGSGNSYGFLLTNANKVEQIWDVSDCVNAKKLRNHSTNKENFHFGYLAKSTIFNNEFVAFKHSDAHEPEFIGKEKNQDLQSVSGIDYLIITREEMLSEAERLASYHRIQNNYTTLVVDVAQIYNDFSSGGQDITAIRDFISKLHSDGRLKYVLILGDTSYDYKNRMGKNILPIASFQSEYSLGMSFSFVTDDYFVMTKPQRSSYINFILPDLPIGRILAESLSEAKLQIDKILKYNNALPSQANPFGIWRLGLNFVADDNKDGGIPFHTILDTTLKSIFEQGNNTEYNIKKLYLDAFPGTITEGGQRFPEVNKKITEAFNNSIFLFFLGHGNINGWAQERVFTLKEINQLENDNNIFSRFPLVSTITCDFTLWDNPQIASAGEQLYKHKYGGTHSMITSSREISVNFGLRFTPQLISKIFDFKDGNSVPLGDAYLTARKEFGVYEDYLRINFLGDPAMKLNKPENKISIESIHPKGQIKALDLVKISGTIKDNSSFNGKILLYIFDKKQNKKTLNNDGNLTPILEYTEDRNPIVKVSGKVTNGKFTLEFYIPKDIDYKVGEGKILMYAENFDSQKNKAYDVFGVYPVVIGGINEQGLNDNTPPIVKLYMNNTHFINGGITNENPTLLACITDDTGINATGLGIGHDIVAYLDNKVVNSIVLNDYYNPGEGHNCPSPSLLQYQKGNVVYPFKNLEQGKHTLTFKIWDINNNLTTSSLDFVVRGDEDRKLSINRLLNWPNPFTDKTYINFEHNCDDILSVNVQIYTITGKLVKNISQVINSEPYIQGYKTPMFAIEWDGKDDFGYTVGKGIYIYKVFVKANNQERCKGKAVGVEKLILLK